MPQDDAAVGGDNPSDLLQGGDSQWCSFDNQSVDAAIGKRNVIRTTGNVPRDRLSPFLTDRLDVAGIEVPSFRMTALATNVENEFTLLPYVRCKHRIRRHAKLNSSIVDRIRTITLCGHDVPQGQITFAMSVTEFRQNPGRKTQ